MLLMVGKGIRGGICHSISRLQKLITNTWKIMIEIKNRHIPQFWDANNLYGWAMSQTLPVSNLTESKMFLSLIKILSKTIMKKVMKDIFSKMMFNILENYMHNIYHF